MMSKLVNMDEGKLARLGAALWFRIESKVARKDILWANELFGPHGVDILWKALNEERVINNGTIDSIALASWLSHLARTLHPDRNGNRGLVWTLPTGHPFYRDLGRTYRMTIIEAIGLSRQSLIFVSPFLQEKGLDTLLEEMLKALWRHVDITVITHEANDIGSEQSKALEHLRREAESLPGLLTVYTTAIRTGYLFHAKIIVVDDVKVIIGSANITRPGLEGHFEAGTVLGEFEAIETKKVIEGLLSMNLAQPVFHTGQRDTDHEKC